VVSGSKMGSGLPAASTVAEKSPVRSAPVAIVRSWVREIRSRTPS